MTDTYTHSIIKKKGFLKHQNFYKKIFSKAQNLYCVDHMPLKQLNIYLHGVDMRDVHMQNNAELVSL